MPLAACCFDLALRLPHCRPYRARRLSSALVRCARSYVSDGNVDLGITGEDIVAESGANTNVLVELCAPAKLFAPPLSPPRASHRTSPQWHAVSFAPPACRASHALAPDPAAICFVRRGFGKCRLSVQAPKDASITDPAQLAGKRIVTSFPVLTEVRSVDRTEDASG